MKRQGLRNCLNKVKQLTVGQNLEKLLLSSLNNDKEIAKSEAGVLFKKAGREQFYLKLKPNYSNQIQAVFLDGNSVNFVPGKNEIKIPNSFSSASSINQPRTLTIVIKSNKKFEIKIPPKATNLPSYKLSVANVPIYSAFTKEKINSLPAQIKKHLVTIAQSIKKMEQDTNVKIFEGIILNDHGQPGYGKYFPIGVNFIDGNVYSHPSIIKDLGISPTAALKMRQAMTTPELFARAVRHEGYHRLWSVAIAGIDVYTGMDKYDKNNRNYPEIQNKLKKLLDINKIINLQADKTRGEEVTDVWLKGPKDFLTFIKDSVFNKNYNGAEGHPDTTNEKLVSCALTLENHKILQQRLLEVRSKNPALYKEICATYLVFIQTVIEHLLNEAKTLQANATDSLIKNRKGAIIHLLKLFNDGKTFIEKLKQQYP